MRHLLEALDQLTQAQLLAAQDEHRDAVLLAGQSGERALADAQDLVGGALALVPAPFEQRLHRAQRGAVHSQLGLVQTLGRARR